MAAAMGIVASVAAPAAVADPAEPFSADVLPTSSPASTSVTFTATIRNDAAEQHLGSVNLTVPAGFAVSAIVTPPAVGNVTFTSTVVRLRGLELAPGGSASVGFDATTPVAGEHSWHDPAKLGAGRIEAKPTSDFSGGEAFVFDPSGSHVDALVGTAS